MDKKCNCCGNEYKGRSDKLFCSDRCRNYYNNKLNRDATNGIRNINNTLRKNRRILEQFVISQTTKVNKTVLAKAGFNFNYFTSISPVKSGTYYYCYDYGYKSIGEDVYFLVKKK